MLQQPFPNPGNVIVGLARVYVGLGLFVQGLESGLFPLDEALARGFANKGSLMLGLGLVHVSLTPNWVRSGGNISLTFGKLAYIIEIWSTLSLFR